MLERDYQRKLIKRLKAMFPGSVILKNDPNYIQGIPDLLILSSGGRWAALETKRSASSSHRPNQDFYVNKLRGMGYASFISPDNEEEVLHEVQRALQPDRPACVPERQ